jgi:ankyrin repeat protein
MRASENGHLEVVRTLLAAKADVNATTASGATALILASQQGHLEVVRALLDANADVNAEEDPCRRNGTGHCGDTALSKASLNRHGEVMDLLKEHGGHL